MRFGRTALYKLAQPKQTQNQKKATENNLVHRIMSTDNRSIIPDQYDMKKAGQPCTRRRQLQSLTPIRGSGSASRRVKAGRGGIRDANDQ